MLISDERIGVLARRIAEGLCGSGLIAATDPEALTAECRRALTLYCQREAVMDQKARGKIATLKRGVAEGSREWEILYQKYYEEELNKFS